MRRNSLEYKLVPNLTVDNAKDTFSKNAMATFREQRKVKGKKLYSIVSV